MQSLLIILGIFYLIPLFRLICVVTREIIPFSRKRLKNQETSEEKNSIWVHWRRFVRFIANIEYVVFPFRSFFVGVPTWIACVGLGSFYAFNPPDAEGIRFFIILIAYSWLVLWSNKQKVTTDLKILEYLRCYPQMHPTDFFSMYKHELAFGGVDFTSNHRPRDLLPNECNFRRNKRAIQSVFYLVQCLFESAVIAHICLSGLKHIGQRYVFEVADAIGSIWGKRALQISQNSFAIKGSEKLNGKKGKFIFIFNHKSSFDFVLTFLAFSQISVNNRPVRPRFIVARDHFKDNPLAYRFFGIGKVCEAIDMVFIARKNREQSILDLKQAARFIVEKGIDIAVYPQGTRAVGNYDRALKRRDAGYYTTISKKDLTSDLAHLKKGTSYLILDTLKELQKRNTDENLHLVFVGIKGAATTFPKDKYKIQTENDIEFEIGQVVTMSPAVLDRVFATSATIEEHRENQAMFVNDINHLIDENLANVLQIRDTLTQRYLTELKGQFRYPQDKIDAITEYLKIFSQKGDVIYQILDRIYSLPISDWNGYLSQLSQLLLEQSDLERLIVLLREVSEELVQRK